jgi:hypothetical protein
MRIKNMNKIKTTLIGIVFLSILNFAGVAQDKVTIHSGTDTFVRDMPTTLSEAQKLIQQLADMYNTLNNQYITYQSSSQAKLDDISAKVDTAEADANNAALALTAAKLTIIQKQSDLDAALAKLAANKAFGIYGTIGIGTTLSDYEAGCGVSYTWSSSWFAQAEVNGLYTLNGSVRPVLSVSFGKWIF